jgi:hypothetical protein
MKTFKRFSYLMFGLVALGFVDLFVLDGQYGASVWHFVGQQADMAKATFNRLLDRFA